ncbi:MAG: DUF4079 domain-containing protein [Microcystaceae cyanobacterium]
MTFVDGLSLIHPALVVVFVFPLIGIVVNYAWQTYQRRIQAQKGQKTKIPPLVGRSHVDIGKWLAASVVGVVLIALAYAMTYGGGGFIAQAKEGTLETFSVIFVILVLIGTIASLFFLYKARTTYWRAILATLTGMGLVLLGVQDGVWRNTPQWYWSHYYYGIVAAFLMILSLATIPDIYQDRKNRWRYAHIVSNCIALLFFIGLGITGARDLLEIPLTWQKQHLFKCDFANQTCPETSLLPSSRLDINWLQINNLS